MIKDKGALLPKKTGDIHRQLNTDLKCLIALEVKNDLTRLEFKDEVLGKKIIDSARVLVKISYQYTSSAKATRCRIKAINDVEDATRRHTRVLQELQNDNSLLAKRKIEESAKKLEEATSKSSTREKTRINVKKVRDNAKDKYECAVKARVQYMESAIEAGIMNDARVKTELAKLGEAEDKHYSSFLSLRTKRQRFEAIIHGRHNKTHIREAVKSLHQRLVIRTGEDKPSNSELISLSERFNDMKRKIMATTKSD
jgi:hypothetical protein